MGERAAVCCVCTTASCGEWSTKLLDNRREKCPKKLLDNRLESALEKKWRRCPKEGALKKVASDFLSFFSPEKEYQRVNA